jgi:hypothetical protein
VNELTCKGTVNLLFWLNRDGQEAFQIDCSFDNVILNIQPKQLTDVVPHYNQWQQHNWV